MRRRRRFTLSEFSAGELALRRLDKELRDYFRGDSSTGLAEYYEYIESDNEEEESERVRRYALFYASQVIDGLTFEEVEKWIRDSYECYKDECGDEDEEEE